MEEYRDVVNYEGLYQVSNLGNVKSLARRYVPNDKIMKQTKGVRGYYIVGLSKGGKMKIRATHQLVAESFLNHRPDGTTKIVVDHIDNNPLNNRVDNLQLISNRENSTKDLKDGTSKYTGVRWNKAAQKWMANITIQGKIKHLGCYTNELEASKSYQQALDKVLVNEQAQEENKPLPFTLDDIYKPRIQASKFKGVTLHGQSSRWRARITTNGDRRSLGLFKTELEAAEAYQIELKQLNQSRSWELVKDK